MTELTKPQTRTLKAIASVLNGSISKRVTIDSLVPQLGLKPSSRGVVHRNICILHEAGLIERDMRAKHRHRNVTGITQAGYDILNVNDGPCPCCGAERNAS